MKQINLNLRKSLLLVELPEGVKYFEYAHDITGIYLQWHDGQIDEFEGCIGEHGEDKISDNPRDEFKRIGRFNSIPESYWEGVVSFLQIDKKSGYRDYQSDVFSHAVQTAKDSVISAIYAEGFYLNINQTINVEPNYNDAEEKVINLNNVWVFEVKEVFNG